MSQHQYSIDKDRLHDLLGTALEATAALRGVHDEREAVREQRDRLKMSLSVTRQQYRGHDLPPQSVSALEALERQLARITERQSELNTRLTPRIALGRRAASYAKQNYLAAEVNTYGL